MRGPLERFASLLIAALLRLGVEPKEAARLGQGAAEIIAQHAAGMRFQLSPGRRSDAREAATAARLRREGLSFAAIGEKLRCSPATAWRRARAGARFASPAMGETSGRLSSGERSPQVAQGCK